MHHFLPSFLPSFLSSKCGVRKAKLESENRSFPSPLPLCSATRSFSEFPSRWAGGRARAGRRSGCDGSWLTADTMPRPAGPRVTFYWLVDRQTGRILPFEALNFYLRAVFDSYGRRIFQVRSTVRAKVALTMENSIADQQLWFCAARVLRESGPCHASGEREGEISAVRTRNEA